MKTNPGSAEGLAVNGEAYQDASRVCVGVPMQGLGGAGTGFRIVCS